MSVSVVFVFESNKRSQTDYHYVRAILKEKYDRGKYRDYPIFAGSKSMLLEDKPIANKVSEIKKKTMVRPEVVVFADVDSGFLNDFKLNKKIEKHCKENNYNLVWFNRNIEEVVLGRIVNEKDKVKIAENFTISRLEKNAMAKMNVVNPFALYKTSNLFPVLDKILPKKN